MDDLPKTLMIFQIGPVQDFIGAARTPRDLWSGSLLIANLSAEGMHKAEELGAEIIFPSLKNAPLYKRLESSARFLEQPTLPNRFCAIIPQGKESVIPAEVEKAVRNALDAISEKEFQQFCSLFPDSGAKYEKRWHDQVARFLQTSWQTVPLDENDFAGSYENLLKNLAARRNTRNFLQYPVETSPLEWTKDALNGKDEIVGDAGEWKKVREKDEIFNKDDKSYGALSVIKRLWCGKKAVEPIKNMPDLIRESDGRAQNYVAMLKMDGDHMGAIIGNPSHGKDFFGRFSEKLANFTGKKAKNIIEKHHGTLIYAGGDDVLALLPASFAFECACELRQTFCSDDPEMPGSEKNLCPEYPRASISAGLAFCHYKTPIAEMLKVAGQAEHRAKQMYDRDALAMTIVKRSGEITEWGCKFDSPAVEVYRKFVELDEQEIISGRFASSLALYLRAYILEKINAKDKSELNGIVAADFDHVCERQATKTVPADFKTRSRDYLDELAEVKDLSLTDFPKLFLCANFLIRKGGQDD
ncbi:MAG: type III-B CRISPR-associated protein Cas10/Cmr2 [Victivallaceae bacterium]|nr:type III-B CRISPR-associated protein Cas10/Cmr2 [Victivallaceae bacterium]